jgi:hypothetical protein
VDRILGFLADDPVAVVIAAGEVGFWVLIATMIDLAGGGRASALHGLAAVYLGFSVVSDHA